MIEFNWHSKYRQTDYSSFLQLVSYVPFSYCHPFASIYYKLYSNEQQLLQPGMYIKVGKLQFVVERFNMGVVSKIGNRPHMEDIYICQQDMGIDTNLKASLFCVIDGHGGDQCAKFLQKNMVKELCQQFRKNLNID